MAVAVLKHTLPCSDRIANHRETNDDQQSGMAQRPLVGRAKSGAFDQSLNDRIRA